MAGTNLPFAWRIKSCWLIALIDQYAATGQYPYNSAVQRVAEKRLGIAQQSDSGSALSQLVYNAQRFQRSDQLQAAGYQPLTQTMIAEAFAKAAHIELFGESLIGNPGPVRLNVRNIDGTLYAMRPHKRKYAVQPVEQPAKIVK